MPLPKLTIVPAARTRWSAGGAVIADSDNRWS